MEKTQTHATAQGGLTAKQRINHIVRWIRDYAKSAKIQRLVVGISGGIDSSVVSALCARTGLDTVVVQMPIRQARNLDRRSSMQATWLLERHKNVMHVSLDLTTVFGAFEKKLEPICRDSNDMTLAFANTRARLRMITLYQIAQSHGGIVVGTGNRVEDFGVGFFTKYGDGGVDISPIGDCMKTEVWDMGRELGLPQEIIDAEPTDGLWDDGRTDEGQLGMTYPELETAMRLDQWEQEQAHLHEQPLVMSRQEKTHLRQYRKIRQRNLHKMLPIPVCKIPQ